MSTTNECRKCGGRAELLLCWPCAKSLRRMLVGDPQAGGPSVCWYLDRLAEAAWGGTTLGTHDGPRAPVDTRAVPYGHKAARLRGELIDALRRWVGEQMSAGGDQGGRRIIPLGAVWHDFIGPLRPGEVRVPNDFTAPGWVMAEYLARSLPALMAEPGSAQMMRDLKALAKQAERVINRPPDEYAGPCPEMLEADETGDELVACEADLFCERDALTVTCYRCRASHDVSAIRALAIERVDSQPQTGANLFRLLSLNKTMPVARSTFYKLLAGVVPRMYEHPDGQRNQRSLGGTPLFAYGEVLKVVEGYEPPPKGKGGDDAPPGAKRTRKRARRTAA